MHTYVLLFYILYPFSILLTFLVPLRMFSIICDGHAIDCTMDRRLVESYIMPRKTTKGKTGLRKFS